VSLKKKKVDRFFFFSNFKIWDHFSILRHRKVIKTSLKSHYFIKNDPSLGGQKENIIIIIIQPERSNQIQNDRHTRRRKL